MTLSKPPLLLYAFNHHIYSPKELIKTIKLDQFSFKDVSLNSTDFQKIQEKYPERFFLFLGGDNLLSKTYIDVLKKIRADDDLAFIFFKGHSIKINLSSGVKYNVLLKEIKQIGANEVAEKLVKYLKKMGPLKTYIIFNANVLDNNYISTLHKGGSLQPHEAHTILNKLINNVNLKGSFFTEYSHLLDLQFQSSSMIIKPILKLLLGKRDGPCV